jgi:hypothetical protein
MGARTYWTAPVPPMNYASGAAFTGTSILDISPGALLTPRQVPALVPELGTILRLRATGSYTATTGAANIGQLGFWWGGVAGVQLAGIPVSGGTALTTVTGAAAWPWTMWYEGEFRALGSSGSIQGSGELLWPTSLLAWTSQPIPQVAASRLVTVSTAAAQPVTVGANWTSVTGTPSITCDRLTVELVG